MTIATWLLASLATLVAGESAAGAVPSVGFIRNEGQWDADALFASRGPEGMTFLTRDGLRIAGPDGAVFWTFQGTDPEVRVEGLELLPGRFHFFLGRDPAGWRRGVPVYASVRYRALYPGIDLVVQRSTAGLLEYDLVLSPGADPRSISLRIDGGEASLNADGSLLVTTEGGCVLHRAPRGFLKDGLGACRPVTVLLNLEGAVVRYEVPSDIGGDTLVIDPELLWSSFYGGAAITGGGGPLPVKVAALDDGSVIVAGVDSGWQFPTTPNGYDPTKNSSSDAYVMRVSADGATVLYGSYIGGSSYDGAFDAVQLGDGSLVLAGTTYSPDFPATAGAYQPFLKGPIGGFVLKLSADGASLDFSTHIGGSVGENLLALDVDAQGRIYVAGESSSYDYPVTPNAFQGSITGTPSPFLAIFSSDASGLVYSSYFGLGGTGRGIHALDAGSLYLAVSAVALESFPVTPGAFDVTHNGYQDGYVARFDWTSNVVVWGTYIGGESDEFLRKIDFADDGVYLAGTTTSGGYPTSPGALQTQGPGSYSGFGTKLAPDGKSLLWSTYLGGWHWDWTWGMDVEPSGAMLLTGETFSPDFPVTPDAMQKSLLSSKTHGYVAKLDPTGSKLLYSTYFSGAGGSIGDAIGGGPTGVVFVSGRALGDDFPVTSGSFDPGYDLHAGFIAAFDLCGGSMTPYGGGCAGGGAVPSLSASGCASPGERLSVILEQAIPSGMALLLLGLDDETAQIKPGCLVAIAPVTPLVLPMVVSGNGSAQVDATIPAHAVPGTIYLQAVAFDPAAPWKLAVSNALRMEIGY